MFVSYSAYSFFVEAFEQRNKTKKTQNRNTTTGLFFLHKYESY